MHNVFLGYFINLQFTTCIRCRTMEEMNVGVRYSVEANKVEDSDGELFAKDAITSY